MARRRKSRKGRADVEWPEPLGALVLTKKDVAQRELATAIRLFVNGGDPVAIYVLASAAAEVMGPIGRGAFKETWRVAFLDRIKDEFRDAAEDVLDEPFNFMKHGASDPEAELRRFNPAANEIFLLLLCRDFGAVFGETFVEAIVYLALQADEHPDLIKDPDHASFAKMLESVRGLAGTDHLDLASASRAIARFEETVSLAATLGIDLSRSSRS